MPSLQSVLITRPEGQGDTLIERLKCLVRQVTSLPLIRIVPLDFNPPILMNYQGIIVTSTNAVRHGIPVLIQQITSHMTKPDWYAIGGSTQHALVKAGIPHVNVTSHHIANSEALLEMASLQAIENQRFLILKGEGGRSTLRDTLLNRNALVDETSVYRRENPRYDAHEITTLWHANQIDTIVFTSVSCIENLVATRSKDIRQLLAESCVIVASERIAKAFANHGLISRELRIAAGADDEALIAAIQIKPNHSKDP